MNHITQTLKQEVNLLRSAVAGLLVRDKEGVYKNTFVKETLREANRKPTKVFTDSKSFLSDLDKK